MVRSQHQRRSNLAALGVAICLACLLGGCSRALYRIRADKEVKYLVSQKSNDARWQYNSYTIGMDPRSRYFDPTSPDCPPMPYDDPAAHRYMHCVDGRNGYPCWHMNGDGAPVENPLWKIQLAQYNELTKDDAIKLTMNGAVCLAQIHSDNWRDQIEQIYLSALDVSTERFAFDVQFFGDSATVFSHNGQAESPKGEQNTLTVGSTVPGGTFAMNKKFVTGAQLVVGFANSFVWQFAGTNTNNANSLINFNFIQPLLRNGGRQLILEALTRVERNLLYDLRQFERYRQGFYCVNTVGNSFAGAVQTITRQGGLLGGTGLTGFTGQGANGQGGIGVLVTGAAGAGGGAGGQGAGLGLAGAGAGPVGGFLGLLQQLYGIRVTQANLSTLGRTLGLLEANLDAGLVDIVQVDNFRQNIETQRASLILLELNYQTALDTYKTGNLTLPPSLPVEPDDSVLRPFEFLDPRTTAVQHMIEDFVKAVGELPKEPTPQDIKKSIDVLGQLRKRLSEQFKGANTDLEKLETMVPERKKTMSAKEAAAFDAERVKLRESLEDVQQRFNASDAILQGIDERVLSDPPSRSADELVALATELSGLAQEMTLVKARARLESITIPKVDLTSDRALEIARAYRLDWMNQRAVLVDTWRLIAFNAQQLKAGLNLTFSGDLNTLGNNPVAFNGQNGDLKVGLAFDAPFTRRLERNNYRSSLITYQQQRRNTYQFEDGVNFILRNQLRTLSYLEMNLEIQRRAVVLAIRRVDKTREDLNKPPAPVQPGQQVEPLGPTVAQNLLTALNDLQQTQNNFLSVVLNHYENRMLLYRELGIMELDNCGMWIDKPLNADDWPTGDDCGLPPDVPAEWMRDAGVTMREMQQYEAEHAGESTEMRLNALREMTGGHKIPPARSAEKSKNARVETSVERAPARPLEEVPRAAETTPPASSGGERTAAAQPNLLEIPHEEPEANEPAVESESGRDDPLPMVPILRR